MFEILPYLTRSRWEIFIDLNPSTEVYIARGQYDSLQLIRTLIPLVYYARTEYKTLSINQLVRFNPSKIQKILLWLNW